MQPFDDADINTFFTTSLAIPTRTLFMGSVDPVGGVGSGETDDEPGTDFRMSERVIKSIHVLDSINHDPITIIMNNLGGDYYHGMAIYDSIRTAESPTTIKVFGHAMSMGSIILQASNKRLLSPKSSVMVHYGTDGFDGDAKDLMPKAKEGERLNEVMVEIYLERIREKNPRYSANQVRELIKVDKWMGAAEAVEIGLADSLL